MLHERLKPEWWSGACDQDDLAVWQDFAVTLRQWASDLGPMEMLKWLASSASHAIRITDPQSIDLQDAEKTLNFLYNKYVCDPGTEILQAANKAIVQTGISGSRRSRWVTAASVVLVGGIAMLHGRFYSELPSKQSVHIIESSTLNSLADNAYRPMLTILSLKGQLPTTGERQPPGQRNPVRAPRVFRTLPVLAQQRSLVALTRLPEPAISIPIAMPSEPLLSFALPVPPKFKGRNRMLRALDAIAAPFRLLASK